MVLKLQLETFKMQIYFAVLILFCLVSVTKTQEITTLESLIETNLPNCYIVRLENSTQQKFSISNIPIIELNLRELDLSSIITYLGSSFILQHHPQCVTFIIDLQEFKTPETIFQFLGHPNLQSGAEFSFLVFHTSEPQYLKTDQFGLNQALVNYPFRIHVTSDRNTGNIQKIQRFCYYCFEDGPGWKNLDSRGLFYDSRKNLHGFKLRCTAPPAPPLVLLVNGKNGELEIVGMMEVILKEIARTLNFTFSLKKASGGLTGTKLQNGSWNGIMGEVLSGEADIGLSVATSYERNHEFDFTIPVFNAFLVLVSTKPTPFFNWEAIFYPFRNNAWVAILVTTIIALFTYRALHNTTILIEDNHQNETKVGMYHKFFRKSNHNPHLLSKTSDNFTIFKNVGSLTLENTTNSNDIESTLNMNQIVSKWQKWPKARIFLPKQSEPKMLNTRPKTKKANRKLSYFQSTYLIVGALLEQGVPLPFNTIPSRVFAGTWLLIAIVVTCAYRSKLFLFLTFPTLQKPPSTFAELSASSYSYGLKSLGGIGLLFITESPVSYIREIGIKLDISTDKYSCLDNTVTKKFVCIIYRAYIDYMMELRYWNMRHKFFISDYLTPPVGSSWVLKKHSHLTSILNKFHAPQLEMGLGDKYIDMYTQGVANKFRILARDSNSKVDKFDTNLKYVEDDEPFKPLKLQNLYGPFFILFFGIVVATISFVLEKFRRIAKTHEVEVVRNLKRRRGQLGASLGFLTRRTIIMPQKVTRSMLKIIIEEKKG